jgi:DNA repair exonuclease SbcCD nuclease subunit
MKLLLSGDLHIGRSSTRMPASVPREELRAANAWNRIVDLAIEEGVAAVCLSGDIIDQDNKFWEAVGSVEQGISRLANANIRTFVVAGNHDHDVLTRLANQLPGEHFTLLGRGGIWERVTFDRGAEGRLYIDGWSFPASRMHTSPLDGYNLPADHAVPTLGMVHGDLDVLNTPYARLDLRRLQSLPPAGWLLGHVHASKLIHADGAPWVLYPGSPQALDPGETGIHGPWMVNVASGALGLPEQRPLSNVCYSCCQIDLSGTANETDVEGAVLNGIRDEIQRIVSTLGSPPAAISLRLRLIGSTPAASVVRPMAQQVVEDLSMSIADATVCIDTIDVETVPAVDLVEHAKSKSATGVLARLLLELDGSELSSDIAELLRHVKSSLEELERSKDFLALDRREIDDQRAREYLRSGARALLTERVSQSA